MKSKQELKKEGAVLLIVGVVVLGVVGLGYFFTIMATGRFIIYPIFQILLAGVALCAGYGGYKMYEAGQIEEEPSPEARSQAKVTRERAIESHDFGDDNLCKRCGKVRNAVAHFAIPCDEE